MRRQLAVRHRSPGFRSGLLLLVLLLLVIPTHHRLRRSEPAPLGLDQWPSASLATARIARHQTVVRINVVPAGSSSTSIEQWLTLFCSTVARVPARCKNSPPEAPPNR